MNKFYTWLLRYIVRKNMHRDGKSAAQTIIPVFDVICEVYNETYFEDNKPTRDFVIRQCLETSLYKSLS